MYHGITRAFHIIYSTSYYIIYCYIYAWLYDDIIYAFYHGRPHLFSLLTRLDAHYVASASLGQVYKGRMHDGRAVALKVQRPGVRDVLGLDWAVATLVSKGYQTVVGSPNDYGAVAPRQDAKGIDL